MNPKVYIAQSSPNTLVPKQALKWFENKAFTWKGILSNELLAGIKRVLNGAITTGQGLSDTMTALDEVFSPYIGNKTALPDQEQKTPYRLETLIRTVTTEAYNQGRKDMFEGDPFVVGFRFSAILDSRTTPVCRFLHGKVLPVGSPWLDRLSPPRHHQCRSLLVPVTANLGPPAFINEIDVNRAIQLSGRDFSDHGQDVRVYGDVQIQGGPAWEVLAELAGGLP